MYMRTSYKIHKCLKKITYIGEYWDDVLIFKYTVFASYRGGNIVEFMQNNSCLRNPNYDGIDEYHRRTFILDF